MTHALDSTIETVASSEAREPVLSVEGLQVEYHTGRGIARAVNGVSFSVHAGEKLAIVGESGCGKTATLLAALRLLPSPPSKTVGGSVKVDGVDLMSLGHRELNEVRGRDISIVFQDALSSFNPVLTVGRQISEGVRQERKLSKKQAHELAIDMLQRVGVPDPEQRARQYPHQLSGGMRQRAMIAMALAGDPKVLFADEPTTALDVTVQAQILDLVRSFEELAIVWVTHDLGVVAGLADRVVVMYSGFIVEEAPIREIFHSPKHPYTRALLDSVPRSEEAGTELASIPGSPPDLLDLPKGCPFYDRCPVREDRCRTDRPELELVGPAQNVACWVAQEEVKTHAE
ncbi:MAG: ABC transporter ATP-binding protein [Leucobacter sp.]